MTDARLLATNPEDSSLVPVACNAQGRLLTTTPVIQAVPNDLEVDGDLDVNGVASITGKITTSEMEVTGELDVGGETTLDGAIYMGDLSGNTEGEKIGVAINSNYSILCYRDKGHDFGRVAINCGGTWDNEGDYNILGRDNWSIVQTDKDMTRNWGIRRDGAAWFAEDKAGFTAGGELFFYSRGVRYKAVVQNGNMMCEPYTREMELRERAEELAGQLDEPLHQGEATTQPVPQPAANTQPVPQPATDTHSVDPADATGSPIDEANS